MQMNNVIIKNIERFLRTSVVNPATRTATKAIGSMIYNRVIYTMDISHKFPKLYDYVIPKIFKRLPPFTNTEFYGGTPKKPLGITCRRSIDVYDYVIYKGVPIVAHVSNTERTGVGILHLILYTINTNDNVYILNDFIEHMDMMGARKNKGAQSTNVHLFNSEVYNYILGNHKLRCFDDTFIPSEQKNLLTSTVDSYINNRQWYENNNIPNHLGILLYGDPGTGKTSVAQAIAQHINVAELYMLDGDCLHRLPSIVMDTRCNLFDAASGYTVLVIEDIDCSALSRNRDDVRHHSIAIGTLNNSDDDDDEDISIVGTSSILNILDGIGAPSNVIYIFTTNHIDKLDPALIRPGRIDLCVKIPSVTPETLDAFCKHHYGKGLPDKSIEIKDNLVFGQLQIDVMRGLSMEDLIETIKK